ncbi:hypothetical protein AB3N59_01715 [Leptospira sp. WS92.C1]
MKQKILILVCFLFLYNCIGIAKPPEVLKTFKSISKEKKLRFEFTGFGFYNSEIALIRKKILEKGYSEDDQSNVLLEIILEEQEHKYFHRGLHALNFILSLFTLGIFPYHVRTEHKITYRIFEKMKSPEETSHKLVLDQWRGILLIPFTPFFWPSSAFEKSLINSIDTLEKTK